MSDIAKLAELFRPDDTFRFKLFSQKVIVQEDARITVEVHALVSTSQTDHKSLEQKIRAALTAFILSDWSFSTIQRGGEAVGYERVTLSTSLKAFRADCCRSQERSGRVCIGILRTFRIRNALGNYLIGLRVSDLPGNFCEYVSETL